jgi:predicted RNA-binding protein with PIN domain
MHIIIDGYNVLKQVLPLSENRISENQRRAFINLLNKYAIKKNHSIIIVFDGGPTAGQTREKDHGIIVIHSGHRQSADYVINQYIEQHPYNLLVVTSDNEIKETARRHKATNIEALEFYSLLKQSQTSSKPEKINLMLLKTSTEKNPFIDALMQNDNQPIYKIDEQEQSNRNSKSHRFSKKERLYQQKIKKL